jgi:hypothetical protein
VKKRMRGAYAELGEKGGEVGGYFCCQLCKYAHTQD